MSQRQLHHLDITGLGRVVSLNHGRGGLSLIVFAVAFACEVFFVGVVLLSHGFVVF